VIRHLRLCDCEPLTKSLPYPNRVISKYQLKQSPSVAHTVAMYHETAKDNFCVHVFIYTHTHTYTHSHIARFKKQESSKQRSQSSKESSPRWRGVRGSPPDPSPFSPSPAPAAPFYVPEGVSS
jgi:hypothetical protein